MPKYHITSYYAATGDGETIQDHGTIEAPSKDVAISKIIDQEVSAERWKRRDESWYRGCLSATEIINPATDLRSELQAAVDQYNLGGFGAGSDLARTVQTIIDHGI